MFATLLYFHISIFIGAFHQQRIEKEEEEEKNVRREIFYRSLAFAARILWYFSLAYVSVVFIKDLLWRDVT